MTTLQRQRILCRDQTIITAICPRCRAKFYPADLLDAHLALHGKADREFQTEASGLRRRLGRNPITDKKGAS